jgi:hypothetical protein
MEETVGEETGTELGEKRGRKDKLQALPPDSEACATLFRRLLFAEVAADPLREV